MSEFGGRSELGNREGRDRPTEKRPSGDWSLDLKPKNPDPLGECKGESDHSVFSTSPFTKTPTAAQPISRGGDWSKDLKPTEPTPEIIAKREALMRQLGERPIGNPADDLLQE